MHQEIWMLKNNVYIYCMMFNVWFFLSEQQNITVAEISIRLVLLSPPGRNTVNRKCAFASGYRVCGWVSVSSPQFLPQSWPPQSEAEPAEYPESCFLNYDLGTQTEECQTCLAQSRIVQNKLTVLYFFCLSRPGSSTLTDVFMYETGMQLNMLCKM